MLERYVNVAYRLTDTVYDREWSRDTPEHARLLNAVTLVYNRIGVIGGDTGEAGIARATILHAGYVTGLI